MSKLKWLFQGLLTNFIWFALSLILALSLSYLEILQKGYTKPILIGVGSFLLFIAIGSILRWMVISSNFRHQKVTAKEAKSAIRNWIDQAGLEMKNAPLDHFVFRYFLKQNGKQIIVSQLKDKPQYLYFQALCTADDNDNNRISNQEGGPDSVIRLLRILLAVMKIGYTGIGYPLKEMSVFKTFLITNEFNEYQFFEAVKEVEAALVLVLEITGEQINSQSKQTPPQIFEAPTSANTQTS